jgi:dTDP-4-amino-4,6-dideoxygalactose transaminase
MLTAISRYGPRVLPNTNQIVEACQRRGEMVRGPLISEFERVFAARFGGQDAVTASYGRMAFYYILRALDLPRGSEIIFPALTFWVVPEMARVAGLKPVFADIDPDTFNLDSAAFERAITAKTRAVVPTHLYGLACDMEPVMEIARKHSLKVIEDCAHSLGATYRGQLVGTFGDAGFFSFQTLKPLNTYGGGMALLRDPDVATRVATMARSEPWPSEKRVHARLNKGRAERIFTRPEVFTWTGFPILWAASWMKAHPDVYLWEAIRPLMPLPEGYQERYTNVQAALGLEGLNFLGEWTEKTRAHAQLMDDNLRGLPGVRVPAVPAQRRHVFYQYCVYVPDRDELVKCCIRHGLDVETLHVDVCTRVEMFGPGLPVAVGADQAARAVQVPVYAALTDQQAALVARTLKRVLARSRHGSVAMVEGAQQ